MNYKKISVVADLIGLFTLIIIFINSFNSKCFVISEWYLSLTPILISYIAQLIALYKGEE